MAAALLRTPSFHSTLGGLLIDPLLYGALVGLQYVGNGGCRDSFFVNLLSQRLVLFFFDSAQISLILKGPQYLFLSFQRFLYQTLVFMDFCICDFNVLRGVIIKRAILVVLAVFDEVDKLLLLYSQLL